MPPLLPEGTSLRGRYKIVRTLDASRVRNIYVAEDTHLVGYMWVVKQMLPVGVDATWSGSLTDRFETEARLLSSLEHSNLPKLIDFFIQDNFLFIVREFVPGRDLALIANERGGVMSEKEALKIGIQLSKLMAYLLKKRLSPVIFRELSLSNLILAPDGKIKLINFGFSRLFQQETKMGPPDYSAPEQYAEDGEVDGRTFVFNIGALVYHLLGGQNPGHSPFNLTPLSELNPKLSDSTHKVVERALQNDPKKRFSNLNEFARHLQSALERPKTKSRPKKSRMKAKATKTGTVAVVGSSGTVVVPTEGGTSRLMLAWLTGIVLTLMMGGGLLWIYQIFLRPGKGF